MCVQYIHYIFIDIFHLHPTASKCECSAMSKMKLSVISFSRLALSARLVDVKAAVGLAEKLFSLYPDVISLRHRTKVVYGLQIRAIMLGIEYDIPMTELQDLLTLFFGKPDSQQQNMVSINIL